MIDFTILPSESEDEPTYDLKQEETLFVELDDGQVAYATVISDTSGWCSCEQAHGELAYMIEQACEFPARDGYFVIEGCTGAYFKGDGWTTDDDADFYPGATRPASDEEIAAYA